MKPGIPKGTRDFSPAEMQRRNYIFETIRNVFLLHGFQQIETPAMENLSVLEGKYGEEGDKLLFRILNSGIDFEKFKVESSKFKRSDITEKGLRYDLTVPFARYVVQHRNEITFPFKRFQMQPVWRADRPQRGRYREFYQCDADIIGSDSLLNEVELIQVIDEVFSRLKISTEIKINSRKVLEGIAEFIGVQDQFLNFTAAIDKMDKVHSEAVIHELRLYGFSEKSLDLMRETIIDAKYRVGAKDRLSYISNYIKHTNQGTKGIVEIENVFSAVSNLKSQISNLEFDISLARGLNYYTGAIIEVKSKDVSIGSICGGGRYDDLTGIFGLPNVSGVGISFGVDRIYDVMEELKLFDALKTEQSSTKILFVNFGEKEEIHCLKQVTELRNKGIAAELYPDRDKIKKQMSYADSRKIPFVAFIGEEEMKSGKVKLKDMNTGEERVVGSEQIPDFIGIK
ncbi:MAG TPA: histidine--tRNA ligase [Bacteroidia bacterium]|nr:histidine--tRNA ligase [Bacteroidia bacterium]